MTNEEILKAVAIKAEKNGYLFIRDPEKMDWSNCNWEVFIYNHDFAKAFWGNKVRGIKTEDKIIGGEVWQHHLQIMVLEENPLQYIKKFL